MSNTNDPAFPHIDSICGTLPEGDCLRPGLTKRELFAAMAMQGMLANPEKCSVYKEVAEVAVLFADNLLAELAKQ